MTKTLLLTTLLGLAACGPQAAGERCNPLRATSDCDERLPCVYPTGSRPAR